MLVHLKDFKLFDHEQIELISTFVNHFVNGLFSINELLFELGFVELEFALVKDFHLFFEAGNEPLLLKNSLNFLGYCV